LIYPKYSLTLAEHSCLVKDRLAVLEIILNLIQNGNDIL